MISNLATAIMTKFNETPAGDTLRAQLTGGLYFMEASDDVAYPYGVFTWDGSNVDEIAGDRTSAIEHASITVSLFTKQDDGATLLFSMVQNWIELYDWSELTYPAGEYTHFEIQRTSAVNRGKRDNVWQVDLAYDVMFNH